MRMGGISRKRGVRARELALLGGLLSLAGFGEARAEAPQSAREPRMMKETGEITTVIDALDEDDPFDLNLSLGFEQRFYSGAIRRETSLNQPGLSSGGYVARTENVASFSESTSLLKMGAQVGIYKDLALSLRLPLILANSRELSDLDGSANNPQRLADTAGGQLFSVPFKSPSRSGLDYIGIGADFGILNQARDSSKPTWVVGIEGRIGIGKPLHACNEKPAAGPKCPDPVTPSIDRDPGSSRAVNGLFVHSTFSRRYGQVEPYSGISMLAEFAQDRSEYGPGKPRGGLVHNPPLVGTLMAGIEYIPYERKEHFQRVVLDGRVLGAYHSVGREYTPLFDALGTSQSSILRTPNASEYKYAADNATSIQDPTSRLVWFNGLTEQQGHGRFTLAGSVTYQAGQYIKFNAGGTYTWVQSHLISGADACNPITRSDPSAAGPCHSVLNGGVGPQPITGIPNPYHRPIIDLPGRRFAVDDARIVTLFLNGIVMF
jgi:hypothetical protein